MDRVKRVLEERENDLAEHLALRQLLERGAAERFVQAAGEELVASWEWQASSLRHEDLASWTNVQSLMGGIHARGLAARLDLPPETVWEALRTFVPRVLIMASRENRAARRGGSPALRRPGRRPTAGGAQAALR